MMSSRLLLALTVVGLAACGEVSNPTIDAPIDVPITIDAPGPDALDIDAPPPIDAPVGTRTVTVTKAGTGTGAVTSSAGGINCGGVCAAAVPDGTTLTLTAAPDAGSSFDGWGGACASAGTATTCTLTVTADAAITATFTRLRYPITVALAGNGLGTVVSSPAGINCPGTCSATVDHGTTVTLNAMPSGGSTFLGWSGACSGTGACVITAMAATSVTATFAQNQSLVVTKAGAGTGTVTSSPAGITCGADCSEAYAPGTVVTLTATPTGASTFQGWSGGCTGTATTCTVTVTGAVMVTATFAAPQCTLTVVKAGTGSGTVTSVPAGINCGTDCTETVACGTAITLTASAAGTSTFAGWSGSCTGSGSCSLPMTGDTTITATFNAAVVMPNLVFVTSTTHTGNLGGLAGADAICQARASAAGRAGTYRAWLSTSTTHAISRLGSASGWTLVDGRPFASSQADLAAGRIFYPISLDETGAAQPFASAWSATLGTGMWNSLDNACTNWTSTMPSGVTAGSTLGTSDSWTAHSGNPCTSALRLYCFGVDRAATVTVTPVTGRRIFMTAANWTPGGGIASADAVCASEASAAGLTGTFRALLATTTASAASRFSTTGATWVRADGIAVTSTAAELFATMTATYRVAPNLTAAGAYVDANPRRYLWSGATNLNAVGTAATTCSDWTSSASTVMPQLAELDLATPVSLFGGVGYLTCAGSQRLMCLQQ